MTVCTDKGHGPCMAVLRKSIQQSNAHILVYVLNTINHSTDHRDPEELSKHLALITAIMREKKGTIILDLTSYRRTCLSEHHIQQIAKDCALTLNQVKLCSLGARVEGEPPLLRLLLLTETNSVPQNKICGCMAQNKTHVRLAKGAYSSDKYNQHAMVLFLYHGIHRTHLPRPKWSTLITAEYSAAHVQVDADFHQ